MLGRPSGKSMTSGTKVFDKRVLTTRESFSEYNGSPPGSWVASGNSLVGPYAIRTWTGDDTPLPPGRPKGRRRSYTTLDKRGRVVTRHFYERLPKRSQFRSPTEYDMTAASSRSTNGSYEVRTDSGSSWSRQVYRNCTSTSAGYTPSYLTAPAWTANDDIKLIGKLREELYGSDFNAAVFLGEANQTLRMIGDSAMKIVYGLRAARRGDFVSAAGFLARGIREGKVTKRAQVGSTWLELQYGWLPLLKDIREGASMLSYQMSSPFRRRYVVRGSKSISGPVGAGTYWEFTAKSSVKKQIIAFVSEPPSVAAMAGLLDPELVAWELVPFSFVADWVAPIGSYMEARAFAGRTRGLFVITTKTTRECGELHARPYSLGSTVYTFKNLGGDWQKSVVMTRRLSLSLSVPLPTVKGWEKIASWQHCANAIALLAQVVAPRPVRGPRQTGPYTE